MGEYAVRLSDNQRVKIGTCEDMYYLRFSDRALVGHLSGNVNVNLNIEAAECRFRLPFPDEDDLRPGEYDDYNRAQELYSLTGDRYPVDRIPSETGIIQLRSESGILVNLPCHHGKQLPEISGKGVQVFWNGRDPGHVVLSSLRCINWEGLRLFPVVRCKYCNHAWRESWVSLWEYIPADMRAALLIYATMENPEIVR